MKNFQILSYLDTNFSLLEWFKLFFKLFKQVLKLLPFNVKPSWMKPMTQHHKIEKIIIGVDHPQVGLAKFGY